MAGSNKDGFSTSLLDIPCSILDIQAELAGVRVLTVQGIRKTLNGGTNQARLECSDRLLLRQDRSSGGLVVVHQGSSS